MKILNLCLVTLILTLTRAVCPAAQYVYDDNNQLIKVIYSAQREVSYSYDGAGNILSITVRSVASLPVITVQPANQFVALQEAAAFTVVVTNADPVRFQWQFNGAPIFGATNATLAINHVQAGDAGVYSVVVSNAGGSVPSAPATLMVTATPPIFISLDQDIGNPGLSGRAACTNGIYTVSGGGVDIGGTTDEFHFVYRSLNGNGEIVAQVTGVGNGGIMALATGLSDPGTSGWAKAGVMVREDLTAGFKYALIAVTPGNGTLFQSRAVPGGPTTAVTPQDGAQAPYWVKVVREGNTLTGYKSANGTNWIAVGSAHFSLPDRIYVGLAVTSHNPALLSTATFAQVRIVEHPAGGQDLGLSIRLLSFSRVELAWNTVSNWNYQVQFCSELVNDPDRTNQWQALKNGIQGNGAPTNATDSTSPISQTPRYYRVLATPSP